METAIVITAEETAEDFKFAMINEKGVVFSDSPFYYL